MNFCWRIVGILAAGIVAGVGCTKAAETSFAAPGFVQQALVAGVTDLAASAVVVPAGGNALQAVELKRAEDGVSFTGFISLEPGEYRVELVFSGRYSDYPERLFLGRWTSELFSVTRGNSTAANFSAQLDTLGRESDEGDVDADGLPNLDEILAQTHPGREDSDSDGLKDGEDCDPAVAEKSVRIAAGGSVRDCDGDGYIRRDPPYGADGDDCDDGAAAIHPDAADSCDDAVDSDCDATTCPTEDVNPPVVSDVRPNAATPIGCQGRISAVIEDDSQVNYAQVVFVDNPYSTGTERLLVMNHPQGSDRWESSPIQDASGIDPVPEGVRRINIRGIDSRGNTGESESMIDLRYGLPQISSLTPAELPLGQASVELVIESSVSHGTPHVTLYGVKRSGDGSFMGTQAIILDEGTGARVSLAIDTTALDDGDYLVFATVADDIGNILTPYLSSVLGTTMIAYYPCIAGTSQMIPTRVLSVGASEYLPATMRDLLPRALSEAMAADPGAQLTQINGSAIHPDGTVHLESATSYAPRWSFGFYNSATQKYLDVSWLSFAYGQVNPVVTVDAGSVSEEVPMTNVAGLVDSDRAVQVYGASMNCPGVTGADDDFIQYFAVDGVDTFSVSAMSEYYRASGVEPVMTIFGCN